MSLSVQALEDPCKKRENELLNRHDMLVHVFELISLKSVKNCLEELYKYQNSDSFAFSGEVRHEKESEGLHIWKLDYYLKESLLNHSSMNTITLVIREKMGPFEAGSIVDGCSLEYSK